MSELHEPTQEETDKIGSVLVTLKLSEMHEVFDSIKNDTDPRQTTWFSKVESLMDSTSPSGFPAFSPQTKMIWATLIAESAAAALIIREIAGGDVEFMKAIIEALKDE